MHSIKQLLSHFRSLAWLHVPNPKRMPPVLGFSGLALASLFAIGACADVDMPEQLDRAEQPDQADTLAQQGRRDLGVGNGSDVITIGDSLMHNTLDIFGFGSGGGLAPALSRMGARYRNWAMQGVWMLSDSPTWGRAIPTQFASAISSYPGIKTVIMSGGGNDVIQANGVAADCKVNGPLCAQTLRNIGTALSNLWDQMGAAGVQDVLFVGYSANAGDSGPIAPSVTRNGIAQICAQKTRIRCHIIDPTSFVARSDLVDGYHLNSAANDRLAQAVWQKMQFEGMRR